MKHNLKILMDKLEIDKDIRLLIKQLWKHGYKTQYSCSGHYFDSLGVSIFGSYLTLFKKTGDGWFESNALNYGLRRVIREENSQSEIDLYEGFLIINPFIPNFDKSKFLRFTLDGESFFN